MKLTNRDKNLLSELASIKAKTRSELEELVTTWSSGRLESEYQIVTKRLNWIYGIESLRTRFERSFSDDLKTLSRIHFETSFWIGRHCVDVFLPRYKLIIEIDGGFHNTELKMRKDSSRDEFFKELDLSVGHAENGQVLKYALDLVKSIRRGDTRSIDSRAKERLMRQIFIKTIARNMSDVEHIFRTRKGSGASI